mmetsp:Transcript_63109/g.137146  ORF Transcript_63109/g.137146 Transcript_63109/m.137146 type:complete len:216 (+) Transcript_63109:60-707(+)
MPTGRASRKQQCLTLRDRSPQPGRVPEVQLPRPWMRSLGRQCSRKLTPTMDESQVKAPAVRMKPNERSISKKNPAATVTRRFIEIKSKASAKHPTEASKMFTQSMALVGPSMPGKTTHRNHACSVICMTPSGKSRAKTTITSVFILSQRRSISSLSSRFTGTAARWRTLPAGLSMPQFMSAPRSSIESTIFIGLPGSAFLASSISVSSLFFRNSM